MMLSAWWILVAFIAGGIFGMLALALCAVAEGEPRRDVRSFDPLGVTPYDRHSGFR